MFLPIGDQPNPRGTPWVTHLLIAANVGAYLATALPLAALPADPADPATVELLRTLVAQNPEAPPRLVASRALAELRAYDVFLFRWGYRPAEPSALTLLSSMFLHGGLLHLLGNMLFLWIYGDNVERRLGRVGYALAYLGTGVAATLTFAAVVPASAAGTPMVGASGAISGVLGFYFVFFPRNKVRVFVFLFPFFVGVWLVGARLVLAFYLLIENLLPFFLQGAVGGPGTGVAHGAHIGGFLGGLGAAYVQTAIRRARCRREAIACGPTEEAVRDAQGVLDLALSGRPAAAGSALLRLPPGDRAQLTAEDVADIGGALLEAGRPEAALAVYQQALVDRREGAGPLLLGAGLALLRRDDPAAAYQYLVAALRSEPSPEVALRAREALLAIEGMQKLPVRPRRGG